MPKYFSYFPTVAYDTFDDSGKSKVVTDIFKRVRATLEARQDKTIYYSYNIREGELPEHIAYNYYGSADYHWVVLLMNEIRDPQWCWPLDSLAFDKYITKKYGSSTIASDTVHHYETKEVLSSSNNDVFQTNDVILPSGITVNSDFSYTYTTSVNGVIGSPVTITNNQAVDSISELEYERSENINRSEIVLLRRNLLPEFISEFENLLIRKR